MKALINKSYRVIAAILLVFLAFGTNVFSQHPYVFAQTDQAPSKLQQATTALNQAFNSVWNAEQAGANVTDLLDKLNVAANLLAQAENAYKVGDVNTAVNDADAVPNITVQVTTAALVAKQAAVASDQASLWKAIETCAFAAAVFISILFLVWRRLKRSCISSSAKLTDEAKNHEAK